MAAAAGPALENRLHTVYHGINVAEWNIPRTPHPDQFQLVAVGRLTPKKGFHLLVDAVGQLRESGLNIQAEIIGDGRERESLREQITAAGLSDYIKLPGRLTQHEIRNRFSTASALIMPSIILETNNQDGVANVLLEALATGVPVIASDIPAFTEVIQDHMNGLLFTTGDVRELGECIRTLVSEPALAAQLGEAGKRSVSGMNCSAAAQTLVGLFNQYAG
jgi:glycosyltransferase involved in cell wall biosynthesis